MHKRLPLIVVASATLLGGCASIARFPSNSSRTAVELMKEFGLGSEHKTVGLDAVQGNTIRMNIKVYITDSTSYKRYFGDAGRVFFQEGNIIAYGLIPLPTGDDESKGSIGRYRFEDGIFHMVGICRDPERMLVTTQVGSGEHICWIESCKTGILGWAKTECTIEAGNTLKRIGK